MTIEIIGQHNNWQNNLITFKPITTKIKRLIASQYNSKESDGLLQENAEMISLCIGTVPENRFEQDWERIASAMLLPGQVLIGIGACIGSNNIDAAVNEALKKTDVNKRQFLKHCKIFVGIFSGYDVHHKTTNRIVTQVLKASYQLYVDCKVIQYNELQDIITVLIMAKNTMPLN